MGKIADVLNSNEDLRLDDSFEIVVGSIALPKGGRRRKITRLHGDGNSRELKRSIIKIENPHDQMCLARAIAVCWAKAHLCTPEEWHAIAANCESSNNVLALQHRKVSLFLYKDICRKNRNEKKKLALKINHLAGMPIDRPGNLNDISAFEEALGIRILVVSASLFHRFIYVGSNDRPERPQVFLYHVDEEHFDAIVSVTGFFCSSYYCWTCLKPYDDKNRHNCETTCIVCKSDNCVLTDTPITCRKCNMETRGPDCYKRHKIAPKPRRSSGRARDVISPCQRWWRCRTC
jgi:hypothetical protein